MIFFFAALCSTSPKIRKYCMTYSVFLKIFHFLNLKYKDIEGDTYIVRSKSAYLPDSDSEIYYLQLDI